MPTSPIVAKVNSGGKISKSEENRGSKSTENEQNSWESKSFNARSVTEEETFKIESEWLWTLKWISERWWCGITSCAKMISHEISRGNKKAFFIFSTRHNTVKMFKIEGKD